MHRATASLACLAVCFISTLVSCSDANQPGDASGSGGKTSGGAKAAGGSDTIHSGGTTNMGGITNAGGIINSTGGTSNTDGGNSAKGGSDGNAKGGTTNTAGGSSARGGSDSNAKGGTINTAGGNSAKGGSDGNAKGGTINAAGGSSAKGGANNSGGASANGGTGANTGGAASSGGAAGGGGQTTWPNIRVVGNQVRDRRGNAFAIRSIESMFGNGTSDAVAFVAGHKALGANALGPMPNASLANADAVKALLDAAYNAGLVIGLNADHANQGERFFQNKDVQAVVNRYPNVFLQEAVELGSDMTESEWVDAAKHKVDAYVSLYPDKPIKIGSPDGGRSPRFALDRCQDVVDYYKSKGGRGGVMFTCQLYWKAATASWSYQKENGFKDGLPGILEAIDTMAASPCFFLPGLDNQDDVGYTGWREVMDHIRDAQADPSLRTSFQWWVYFNSGDSYANDLTTKASDALSGITATGRDVKAKLEMDRELIELGTLNQ